MLSWKNRLRLGLLAGVVGVLARQELHAETQRNAAVCKTLPFGTMKAKLDRSIVDDPSPRNKVLQGTLKWFEEQDGEFEGLFVGRWDVSDTPWNSKASWSFPAGQEGFVAQLDLSDQGSPLFVSGRHLISVLDAECQAQAFYVFKLNASQLPRLKKAKSALIRMTGQIEVPADQAESRAP